ncbi:MAG: hypothetical protein PVH61_44580 [Candidatus Aminicenantes bacterium]|jgi:hypothetical protein
MKNEKLPQLPPKEMRRLIRAEYWDKPTAGLCAGYAQMNLLIIPGKYAADFKKFCQLNPHEVKKNGDSQEFHCPESAHNRLLRGKGQVIYLFFMNFFNGYVCYFFVEIKGNKIPVPINHM